MIRSLLIADYGVFWLLVWPIGAIFTILSQLESVISLLAEDQGSLFCHLKRPWLWNIWIMVMSLKWGIIAMRGKVNTCSKTRMSTASTSEV